MKGASKSWWTRARHLLEAKGKASSIPALKVDGVWRTEPIEKANAFVDAFTVKNVMEPLEDNEYGIIQENALPANPYAEPSVEAVRDILRNLAEDSATGPDRVPTRILKFCADELAEPVQLLVCSILRNRRWPKQWKGHWVCPLHKKKSVFVPTHYRGVHLTCPLSKVAERVLAFVILTWLAGWATSLGDVPNV